MSITLTADYAEKVILEPGYHKGIGSEEVGLSGEMSVPSTTPTLWRTPDTGVLMLAPLNIKPYWLNSPDQVASIIRASDMVVNTTDTTNNVIYEENAFGNPNNFYIYHAPAGPTGAPFMPAPGARSAPRGAPGLPAPGAPPSIVGAPYGGDLAGGLVSIENEHEVPFSTFSAPATPTGSVADGKLIAYTKDPLPANQAFYFRWFQPDTHIGYQTRYIFYFGQLALEVLGPWVFLYDDISEAGDRSSYGRIGSFPVFSAGIGVGTPGNALAHNGLFQSMEGQAHERSLLIIPYFRNRLFLMGSAGHAIAGAFSPRVRQFPKRVDASDHVFEITKEATVGVWVMTPAPGRFQLQKVRYATGPGTIEIPPIVLDYTPAVAPTVNGFTDEDHSTDITGTVSNPPIYSLRFNDLYACPPAAMMTGMDETQSFGVQLTFTGESTHRWTPFFYGLTFDAPTVLQNTTTTPMSVVDTGTPATNLLSAMVSLGEKPGDGRMEAMVLDESPYAFAPYYYRSAMPVQLLFGATKAFTGLSDMHEVSPMHEVLRPRHVKIPASDRWKQLSGFTLRDQASKSGIGHITTVLNIANQAGIDTSTAEYPTPLSSYDTPLGLLDSSVDSSDPPTMEQLQQIHGFWKPHVDDTAAEFILRIAKLFSGWDVGFRADGTLYYLPRDYFTAVAYRFFFSRAAAVAASISVPDPALATNSLARNVLTLETEEPEANAVQVIGAAESDGRIMRSSIFVDWASIRNPNVQNYLGRFKPVVITAPRALSCTELNRVARVVFDAVRRRHRRISFESDYIAGLKIGQVVEVGTDGNYRIKKIKAEYSRPNWSATTYEAELVEAGYGL